ncbi:hypothetical protein Fmac_017925 [Flemingia macrophylla]|uniref:Uncharacterized protein n=1 Tax=Flemingia macrophylla TaxID=520843 RepID=A0ABD1M3J5_9FABA
MGSAFWASGGLGSSKGALLELFFCNGILIMYWAHFAFIVPFFPLFGGGEEYSPKSLLAADNDISANNNENNIS